MLECIVQALLFAMVGGPIMGLIVSLFAPLVTKQRLRSEWEARKRKHGFWKAWAIQIGEMMIGAIGVAVLVHLQVPLRVIRWLQPEFCITHKDCKPTKWRERGDSNWVE
jgi:hypothetical protein